MASELVRSTLPVLMFGGRHDCLRKNSARLVFHRPGKASRILLGSTLQGADKRYQQDEKKEFQR